MIGSPLCVISYDLNGIDKAAEKRQEFRVYFQSLFGNVKEAVSSGGASWQTARPIFTDALNNTGLASFTYMNGTQQQGSLFYVGNNGLLQEKRKIYADNRNWEVGKLNNLNIPMTGNLTPAMENDDPRNGWDSYRIVSAFPLVAGAHVSNRHCKKRDRTLVIAPVHVFKIQIVAQVT